MEFLKTDEGIFSMGFAILILAILLIISWSRNKKLKNVLDNQEDYIQNEQAKLADKTLHTPQNKVSGPTFNKDQEERIEIVAVNFYKHWKQHYPSKGLDECITAAVKHGYDYCKSNFKYKNNHAK